MTYVYSRPLQVLVGFLSFLLTHHIKALGPLHCDLTRQNHHYADEHVLTSASM